MTLHRAQFCGGFSACLAAAFIVAACGREQTAGAPAAISAATSAVADTIVLPARRGAPVLLHLRDEVPRDLLELSARDTIDPIGSSKLGEYAIQFGDRIVVADGNRIVFVDSTQRRIWKVGRRGQGPNEFEGNVALCRAAADTIVAMDGIPRVTIIDTGGRIARQVVWPASVFTGGRRCVADGTLVTTRILAGDSLAFERYNLRGELVAPITTVHYDFRAGGTEVFAQYALEYNADALYWGNSWEPELREFAMDGRLRRVFRLSDLPQKRPTGPNVQPAFAPRMGSKAVFIRTPSKYEHYPHYLSARVTADGDLWLRDYPHFFPATERWTGFSHDGKLLGAVTVDSTASVEGRVQIQEFFEGGVLVKYETPNGPIYYRRVAFPTR